MENSRLNFLSLFDGMSCARIVLDSMGITPTNYYAAEVDKFAIAESKANWPDVQHMGDVTRWRDWSIDWASIDLLVGGSPCQGFSFAGNQAGTRANLNGVDIIIETREQYLQAKAEGATFYSQSHLFWEYVLCLDYAKEQNKNIKFMLENVRMKKCFMDMITGAMGVEPVFINSALVSAQSRQRYYWASWHIDQPQDRGIVLADILEEKEYINSAAIVGRKINPETGKRDDYSKDLKTKQYLEVHDHGKARCLSTVAKDCLVSNKEAGRYLESENKQAYRKLTVAECCRLQGVPDDYFKVSSNSQAYKMLGNGWQCDTIRHIFEAGLGFKR